MFYFFKEADDGTYNLMEIYSDRKGNLTAKTFYKTRKGSKQRVIDIEKSLLLTSEASLVHPLSGAKIPQMFETTSVEEEISTNDRFAEAEHRSINPTIIIWYNRTPCASYNAYAFYSESTKNRRQPRTKLQN